MPASLRIGLFFKVFLKKEKKKPPLLSQSSCSPVSGRGGAPASPRDVTVFCRGSAADYRLNTESRFDKNVLGRERARNISGILAEAHVHPFKNQAKSYLLVNICRKTARLLSLAVKC